MKKYLLTLLAVLGVCASVCAQKPVLTANNKGATAKPLVAVVQPDIPKVVNPDLTAAAELNTVEETAQLRLQGREDARQYYKAKGVFWGTMGTTILYPAAGLATGTIVSVIPPSTESAANPNAHLMKEPAYQEAFKKQAHRKRFGNAAAGFGIGIAVLGVVSKVIVGGL